MTQKDRLAAYASNPAYSRGRRYAEPAAPTRDDFQRDRDRIVHCTAFRRLVYKTQVFLNHQGDLFRTRMTHSLEVAQLGRSLARALMLNEDLVETIALAHDLGHTPFGHAGQDVLHECMQNNGGFEHNLQSLRVVDWLEERYPDFDGLNLTFESREGILKHCSTSHAALLECKEPDYGDGLGGVGARFLQKQQPSLEAQLCDLADQIAYNAHDIDDGIRSGLLTVEQMREVPLFAQHHDAALRKSPHLREPIHQRRAVYETIRLMLSEQIYDVIRAVSEAVAASGVQSAQDVRMSDRLVHFSPEMRELTKETKRFLFANLYRHPDVMASRETAKQMLRELFTLYCENPDEMPIGYRHKARQAVTTPAGAESVQLQRVVADYISGMTDRFAASEHGRLFPRHG